MTPENFFPHYTDLTNEECHQLIPQEKLVEHLNSFNRRRNKTKISSVEGMRLNGQLALWHNVHASSRPPRERLYGNLQVSVKATITDGKTFVPAGAFALTDVTSIIPYVDARENGNLTRMVEEATRAEKEERQKAEAVRQRDQVKRGLTDRTFFSEEEKKMLGLALDWLLDPQHSDELAREKAREILLSLSQPSEYEKGVKEGLKLARASGVGWGNSPFGYLPFPGPILPIQR